MNIFEIIYWAEIKRKMPYTKTEMRCELFGLIDFNTKETSLAITRHIKKRAFSDSVYKLLQFLSHSTE